jgi:V8-like Glu-specific endopeptidase
MNTLRRRLTYFAAALLLTAGAVAAQAEGKTRLFDVVNVDPAVRTGPLSNGTARTRKVFQRHLQYSDASWIRLTFTDVRLGDGDFIRIVSPETGIDQVLSNMDPQYGNRDFEGKMISARFAGGSLDISVHVAPGNTGTALTLQDVLVAKGRPGEIQSLCGPTDDRTLVANDACAVRIVDSAGGWGSGFMIGPNCMLTANHVMTSPPWTIERNVPASNGANGNLTPAAAADQFPLANLNGSTASGSNAAGNDWAVVAVPNNAAGAPGAGCNPTFNCNFTNNCNGTTSIRVTGYGIDTRNARNGALQTDSGPCVAAAGGAPATDFTYRVDTTANGSGSRVTDQNGAIIGIHQRGGCNGDNPETGTNGGTTLLAPGLLAAIRARCNANICPTVGVELESWGNVKALYR